MPYFRHSSASCSLIALISSKVTRVAPSTRLPDQSMAHPAAETRTRPCTANVPTRPRFRAEGPNGSAARASDWTQPVTPAFSLNGLRDSRYMLRAESGLMPYLAATGFQTWMNAALAVLASWLAPTAAL